MMGDRMGRKESDLEDRTPLRGVQEDDGRSIDLGFRPATYWPESEDHVLRVARIRGEQRRLRAQAALREGRFDPEEPLFAPELPEDELERWGAPPDEPGRRVPPGSRAR